MITSNTIFSETKNKNIDKQNNINKSKIISNSKESIQNDSINISNVFEKVDKLFDLGNSDKDISNLNEEEKKKYYQVVAKLLKKGIIGYNYYKKNGKVTKKFIETELGNSELDDRDKLVNGKTSREIYFQQTYKNNQRQVENYELQLELQEIVSFSI